MSRKQSSQLFGAKQEDHFGIKIDLVDGRRTALVSLLVGLLTGLGEGLSSFLKFLWLYKPGEPMETLSLYNHCHSFSRTAQGQFATILFFPGGGVSHKMAAQSRSSKVVSSRLVSSPDSTKIQQQGAASYKNVWK